ncbi:long-chain fatty acid--CoA ligase [Ochrobactrum pseudogrignonense]|nr:long-chain fatty acid--CoA ligase [Brucella pseudogrignonensis]
MITAADFEAIDRNAIIWFTQHIKKADRPFLNALEADQGEWVTRELEARVQRDATFGIRYSSSRELEEYFETYAELRARGLPGNDSLPDDCRIGPFHSANIALRS